MAKKQSYPAPFGEPVDINTDRPVTIEELTKVLRTRKRGISIRIRTAAGKERRGGYLFHLEIEKPGVDLFDYRKRLLHRFASLPDLLTFINHVSGRRFDESSLNLCDEINRKSGEPGTIS